MALLRQRKRDSGKPFMKMGNNGSFRLVRDVLNGEKDRLSVFEEAKFKTETYLSQEPCYKVTKNNRFVRLVIAFR